MRRNRITRIKSKMPLSPKYLELVKTQLDFCSTMRKIMGIIPLSGSDEDVQLRRIEQNALYWLQKHS